MEPEEATRKLRDAIGDESLLRNLDAIAAASAEIWGGKNSDIDRVVRDFTDHGIAHAERVIGRALETLDLGVGRQLSSREAYLLGAAAYLHDIGMQCDPGKQQDVYDRAGVSIDPAEYAESLRETRAYPIEVQQLVRSRHSDLAAAWIETAYETGCGVLGRALADTPNELVGDLADICRAHSGHPIADCEANLRFHPSERKQYLAAVLRLADELDIDSSRVSRLETILGFSVSPQSAVYWWLHNMTTVDLLGTAIVLKVRMKPADMARWGEVVQETYVSDFQKKNKPVLDVLRLNLLNLSFSSESGVESYAQALAVPRQLSQAMAGLGQRPPGLALAEEVSLWLSALRYEVTAPELVSGAWNLTATVSAGPFRQRLLVRCFPREIQEADVASAESQLTVSAPTCYLVADRRVADAAKSASGNLEGVKVFTLRSFLEQIVWAPYVQALNAMVEKPELPKKYVDPGCHRERISDDGAEVGVEEYESLDEQIDAWMHERGTVHLSVLGEFGAGKTWFCRHLAYEQMNRYLDDPIGERIPILITLRDFSKTMNARQLVNDALTEQYRLPFIGSAADVLADLDYRGRVLLILDGFDEMARQVDTQTVIDNFWELASLVGPNSKVILTSRTEYFRAASDAESIFSGRRYGRRTLQLTPPRFETLYINPLTDDQLRELIGKRLPPDHAKRAIEQILGNESLAEMARKPVVAELLLSALDEVPDVGLLQNQARVYLYATERLLLRNISAEKTFTGTADKLRFLCELAWEMISSSELSVHYTGLTKNIGEYFSSQIADGELDAWDYDLRSQTLLHRDALGFYRFAHKSLPEYFAALKLAAELGCMDDAFSNAYSELDGSKCGPPYERVLDPELRKTFGARSLTEPSMSAVRMFLGQIVGDEAPRVLESLLEATKGRTFEECAYTGGNALTLMRDLGFGPPRDLGGAILSGADLEGFDLDEHSLVGTDLSFCDLSLSKFSRQALEQSRICETVVLFHVYGADRDIVTTMREGFKNQNSFRRMQKIFELGSSQPLLPNSFTLREGSGRSIFDIAFRTSVSTTTEIATLKQELSESFAWGESVGVYRDEVRGFGDEEDSD